MQKTLPRRSEVPVQYTWDLTLIYPNDAAWEADFAAIPAQLDEFQTYQGRLSENAGTLLAALTLSDTIGKRMERLAIYAFLRRDEDATDATYQALGDRAQQLGTRASAAESFVRPELLALPDGTLERYMTEGPKLRLYAHVFDDLLREKPHVLSEAEETLLAEAGEVTSAPGHIFSMLSNADLKFGTLTDEEGQEVELTEGRYIRFMRSPNRKLREQAFTQLLGVYQGHRNTCAASYAANVKKDLFYSRARKYPTALEGALYGDNIPPSVYTNLIETVHAQLPLLQRYLQMRRQVLGLDDLRLYDLHVPLVAEASTTIPYDEATRMVISALAPLGAEYTAIAQKGFASRWVDVYETPNKRNGAYSWGAYDSNPYILLNYQDTLNDVFTVAHELGHSMHSYFTHRAQPYTYGHYTIFVAEVASTFNEALLTHYLLEHNTDPMLRMTVVNNNLETFRATLYRQTMFAEFEKLAHETAEAGESLTADRLSALFHDLNQRYYGPTVVADEQFAIEWARIPHFYRSFYVYKYATGICAAQALAERVIEEGAPAVKRYLQFLSRGSSAYSMDLLRDAGVDMTSPEPVAQALGVFGRMVDEMERLLQQTGKLTPEPAPA